MSKLTQLVPPTVRRRIKLHQGDRCFCLLHIAPEKRLWRTPPGVDLSGQYAGYGVKPDEDLFVSSK